MSNPFTQSIQKILRIRWIPFITLIIAGSAIAQTHELDHQPVAKSAAMTTAQVVASALENAPEILSLEARSEQARAYQEVSGSLFAGPASVQASYIDDQLLDNFGMREIEAGITVPLWRPGQRQQAVRLGQSMDVMLGAWQSYIAWQVSGRVRESLLELQRAEALLEYEQQNLQSVAALEQLANTLFQAGAVPQLDVLSTEVMVLEQRKAIHDAEAELVDAEREYQVVTGLSLRPQDPFIESLPALQEISLDHPWLDYLQANLNRARANVSQVRERSTGNPLLGLGFRRERANRLDPGIDSVGLSLQFPIGKSPTVAAAVSDARREEADLQVALRQAHINLNQSLHEAEHQVFVIEQKLSASAAQVTLNQRRWEMARLAYELGETSFFPVQLALRELQVAEKQHHSLELELQAIYSRMNQSLGLPL